MIGTRWQPPEVDPRGHYVYIAWSAFDPEEALYVGVNSTVLARIGQHSVTSVWWDEASHISMVPFDDRASAETAEALFIHYLDPAYNVAHPYRPPASDRQKRAAADAIERLLVNP